MSRDNNLSKIGSSSIKEEKEGAKSRNRLKARQCFFSIAGKQVLAFFVSI